MGKRPRTPHFIAGIGDGDVHDGNDDVFRLRGNNNNDKKKKKKNDSTSTDDDNNNNNIYHSNHHLHQQQNRYDLRNHRPEHNNEAIGGNDKFLHQQHDEEEEETAPWSLDADGAFNEHITHIPDMKLDMMGDIVQQLPVHGQLQSTGGRGGGPWQVSAFAFLGILVIISAIILHFVSESSGSSSGSNSKKCIKTSTCMSSNNNNINNDSSSTNRHHSGSNSRPYQYRRRQRQRRLQKLRKKKTDEWSDDEEPIQDGGRFFSMNDKILSSLSRDGDGGDGYGSPPDEYDEYEYENDHEYDYDYDNNNNNSIYHQSDYYREPNSHLAAQDSRLRRTTGITATSATPTAKNTSTTNKNTKEPYDYYDVGVVPTYKSPAASKYMMQATTTKSSSTTSAAIRSTTTPQRGISPMNSYSSGGGGGGGSRQRRPNNNNNFNSSSSNNNNNNISALYHSEKSNFSPTGSTSSPYRDFGIVENSNNNNYKYNNGFIAITPSSTKTPISGKLRIPPTPDALFTMADGQHQQSRSSNDDGNNKNHSDASSSSSNLLPTPRHQNQSSLLIPNTKDTITEDDMGGVDNKRTTELGARLLDTGSRFSSFGSMGDVDNNVNDSENKNKNSLIPNNHDNKDQRTIEDRRDSETWSRASGGGYGELCDVSSTLSQSQSPHHSHNNNESPSFSMNNESFSSINSRRQHQESLLLTPGNSEETPIIGNARKTIMINDGVTSLHAAALLPPMGISDGSNTHDQAGPVIPYIPSLKTSQCGTDTGLSYPLLSADAPPRSITMDELRLVEMETGNSMHWETDHEDFNTSFAGDYGDDHVDATTGKVYPSSNQRPSSDEGSDISIPSGDPRKSIIHKRQNLTMSTDSATSLQSSINFEELQLQEVIGGGGFGQVWKATWRGTPVAVKVLTGSAQNAHIPKAVSEEFKAEINLLKGMRHPNICLYMGACLTPPNRAIITELAANGSAWDSLRLPLMPPYVAGDGTPRGSWPLRLYLPGHHGAPPSSHGSRSSRSQFSAPIPPRGTWPWELVKRVSCGAARGMAYLHSGNPPVLHRDLKSANLLLDESYTAKVCDFGLSRLKAQARSMTANCGTVQWMAPEVLANRSYDEKADIYSFGIIVWELLTRECPYEGMTAIQCALAVLNRDKRPEIPKWCPPQLHALIKSCIKTEPSERPSFAQIILVLDAIE
jgi:hypothetical protein